MYIEIMFMSGLEDGRVLRLETEQDGTVDGDAWVLTIGRREECDIALRNDTFVSREHARLRQQRGRWWLEDNASKNGAFLDARGDDQRIGGPAPLEPGRLFRVGRTWLRLQASE